MSLSSKAFISFSICNISFKMTLAFNRWTLASSGCRGLMITFMELSRKVRGRKKRAGNVTFPAQVVRMSTAYVLLDQLISLFWHPNLLKSFGDPRGIRTPVTGVRGSWYYTSPIPAKPWIPRPTGFCTNSMKHHWGTPWALLCIFGHPQYPK